MTNGLIMKWDNNILSKIKELIDNNWKWTIDNFLDKNQEYNSPVSSEYSGIKSRMGSISKQVKDQWQTIKWTNWIIYALIALLVLTCVWWIFDSWWRLDNMKNDFYEAKTEINNQINTYNNDMVKLETKMDNIEKDIEKIDTTINAQINQKLIDLKLIHQ